MNLITSYFMSGNPERQKELDFCLNSNLNNKSFTHKTILVDTPITQLSTRCDLQYIHARPTFDTFFHFAKPDMWNVVCNSDIYFDETIELLNQRNKKEFVALCRYDVNRHGKVSFFNRRDSQDTWAFYGRLNENMKADFEQGRAGCDNVLLNIAKNFYKLSAPALTIKTYHLHNSNVRTYNGNDRLKPPYELITPHA